MKPTCVGAPSTRDAFALWAANPAHADNVPPDVPRAVDPEIRRHAIEAWGVDPQRDPAALREELGRLGAAP